MYCMYVQSLYHLLPAPNRVLLINGSPRVYPWVLHTTYASYAYGVRSTQDRVCPGPRVALCTLHNIVIQPWRDVLPLILMQKGLCAPQARVVRSNQYVVYYINHLLVSRERAIVCIFNNLNVEYQCDNCKEWSSPNQPFNHHANWAISSGLRVVESSKVSPQSWYPSTLIVRMCITCRLLDRSNCN